MHEAITKGFRAIPGYHIKTVRNAETLCLFAHVRWQLCWWTGAQCAEHAARRANLV
jgi:hypothetical protein